MDALQQYLLVLQCFQFSNDTLESLQVNTINTYLKLLCQDWSSGPLPMDRGVCMQTLVRLCLVKGVRSELRREVCTFNSQLSGDNPPYCPAAGLASHNLSSGGWRAVISPQSISVSFQKNMALTLATRRVTHYFLTSPQLKR